MEVGRLPDLFAGAGIYVHKRSFQGDGGGALVHAPGSNPGSCLNLHPSLTLLIQPSFTASLLRSTPPSTTCLYHAFHIAFHPYLFSICSISTRLRHIPPSQLTGGSVSYLYLFIFLFYPWVPAPSSRGINFLRATGSQLPFSTIPAYLK